MRVYASAYLTIEKRGPIAGAVARAIGPPGLRVRLSARTFAPGIRRAPVSVRWRNGGSQGVGESGVGVAWLSWTPESFQRPFPAIAAEPRQADRACLRNIAIAMGNSGLEAATGPGCGSGLRARDPVLAETAQWASRQLEHAAPPVRRPPVEEAPERKHRFRQPSINLRISSCRTTG